MIALFPVPAWAGCGACNAGDASVSAMGIPDGASLGVVAGMGTLVTRNLAGTRETGLHDQLSEQASLVALWTLAPSVRIQASLPYVRRELSVGTQRWSNEGFGDASASATVVVWKDPGISFGQAVTLMGGITAPTGRRVAGSSEHAQPGLGAWSGLAGASWVAHYELWRFYVSQAYKANTPNVDGYRYGNLLTGNAGIQRQTWTERLDATFEVNARYVDADYDHDGFVIDDTGGTVVYATPGLVAQLGGTEKSRFFLRGSLQIPFINAERGHQQPGVLGQIAVNAAF
ncbi:MAG TPA: transporter [bacterium]|nr:transporter [bacterium]